MATEILIFARDGGVERPAYIVLDENESVETFYNHANTHNTHVCIEWASNGIKTSVPRSSIAPGLLPRHDQACNKQNTTHNTGEKVSGYQFDSHEAQVKISGLENELQLTKNRLKTADAELREYLRLALIGKDDQIKSLDQEKVLHLSKISSQRKQLKDVWLQKEEKLAKVNESLQVKDRQLTEAQCSLLEKKVQLKKVKESLREKEKKLNESHASLIHESDLLKEANGSLREKGIQLAEAHLTLFEKDGKILKIENETTRLKQIFQDKVTLLVETNGSLLEKARQLTEAQDSLQVQEEKLRKIQNQAQELECDFQEKEKQRKEANDSLSVKEKQLIDARVYLQAKEEQLSETQCSLRKMEKLCEGLAKSIQEKKCQLNKNKRENQELVRSIQASDRQVKDLQGGYINLHTNYGMLYCDFHTLRNSHSQLLDKHKRKEEEFEVMKEASSQRFEGSELNEESSVSDKILKKRAHGHTHALEKRQKTRAETVSTGKAPQVKSPQVKSLKITQAEEET